MVEPAKKMYFDNPLVEKLLRLYVMGGCTDIAQRDEIMTHAGELIRQVILVHGIHKVLGGTEDDLFDLRQVAWIQIEKTLYKFDYSKIWTIKRDGVKFKIRGCIVRELNNHACLKMTDVKNYGKLYTVDLDDVVSTRQDNTKIFNMWTQVTKTVCLAYVKHDTKDKKNLSTYTSNMKYKPIEPNHIVERFLEEATRFSKFDDEELAIVEAIRKIAAEGDFHANMGLVTTLCRITDLSEAKIKAYLYKLRLCEPDFSDSPINTVRNFIGNPGGRVGKAEYDED